MNADAIDQAIAATADDAPVTIPITIASTGRVIAVMWPRDVTESELAEFVGFVMTQCLAIARQNGRDVPAKRLVVANRLPT